MSVALSRTERELRRVRIVALLSQGKAISTIAEITGYSQRYVRVVAMHVAAERAGCAHEWDGGVLLRRCLRRYTCRLCGQSQNIDSGD